MPSNITHRHKDREEGGERGGGREEGGREERRHKYSNTKKQKQRQRQRWHTQGAGTRGGRGGAGSTRRDRNMEEGDIWSYSLVILHAYHIQGSGFTPRTKEEIREEYGKALKIIQDR